MIRTPFISTLLSALLLITAALPASSQPAGDALLRSEHAERTLELADRVYVLRTGNIEMSGTSAELAANPEFERAFLGFV